MRTLLDATLEIPSGETCSACGVDVILVSTTDATLVEVRCGCGSTHALG